MSVETNSRQMSHGRIRLVSNYKITGNLNTDIKNIPLIISEIWSGHNQNIHDSKILYDYYFNQTEIEKKQNIQRPDINNRIAIPRAFEIQRKINSYANGLPREYTSLTTDKQKQLEIFNNYQNNECKHSKTQLANMWASITGVGYYCVMPDYDTETISSYEIYDENFSPLNTFIVYDNTMKGDEMLGVNYHTIQEVNEKGETKSFTEFNIFTKYHQFVFKTAKEDDPTQYIVVQQVALLPNLLGQNQTKFKSVDAKPNPFGMIPIIQVNYHPFRIGIFEIIMDLIDCANMFISGDADLRQQAVDYILVLTDCEIAKDIVKNDKGEEVEVEPDITKKRYFSINTNNGTNQAKVEILTNKFDYQTTIDFLDLINGLIEKIVGVPTRKNQDVGGTSSTGIGSKNENGMRDLDDNADIIQAQALLAERKFIKLVLAIDKNSPKKELSGLNAIDIKVSFPRNEQENIVISANSYATLRSAGMNDVDALKSSKITTDVLQTANRNKIDAEEKQKEELNELKTAKKDKVNETIFSETNKTEN